MYGGEGGEGYMTHASIKRIRIISFGVASIKPRRFAESQCGDPIFPNPKYEREQQQARGFVSRALASLNPVIFVRHDQDRSVIRTTPVLSRHRIVARIEIRFILPRDIFLCKSKCLGELF